MQNSLGKLEGIITKVISGFCYVEAEGNVYECKPRGAFRKENITPVAGDKVIITVSGNKGVVESINERKNHLIRPPLANLDKLFIVSSCSTPAINTLLIDRMTAISEYLDIIPVIVFNKCDLGSFGELPEVYRKIGYSSFVVSAETGEGIDALISEIKGCVSAFSGNSGVGKSSILNRLFPTLGLSTGDVSLKLGRGRHTTRQVELFKCNDGYVADTPGFSSLELADFQITDKNQLKYYFKEISALSDKCRFSTCSHTTEPGCSVIDGVLHGTIAKSRHESYISIYNDLKTIKPWEIKHK